MDKTHFFARFFRGTIVSKDNWAVANVNTGYVFRCGGDGILDFTYGDNTSTWRSFTSVNKVLTENVWQHVAVTFQNGSNGSVKFYVNGVSVALATTGSVANPIFNYAPPTATVASPNSQDLGIGTDFYDQKLRNFNGQITEVRLWNVARTASQINVFKNRNPILCERTGLVAYYPFNEYSGTNCNNIILSSAGNGTITTISPGTVTRQNSNLDSLASSQNVIFVKAGVAKGDGTSWTKAFSDLQDALTLARSCSNTVTQIWVAAGTYYPTSGTDRTVSFQLINDVALYGGFAGNEYQLSKRNWVANPTILSGNIGNTNLNTDNSYGVFYHNNTVSNPIYSTAILSGFTISDGNANGGGNFYGGGMYNHYASPKVEYCIFTGNNATAGAGVYNELSSAQFSNCRFWNNLASYIGGGVYNTYSYNVYTNCVFIGNNSLNNTGANGGGAVNINSQITYNNCSLSGNRSTSVGGGMYTFSNYSSNFTKLNNCILWGNDSNTYSSSIEKQYYGNISGNNNIFNNCIIQDVNCPSCSIPCNDCPNGGNIDPLFQTQPATNLGSTGDLRLKYASPAINTGTNTISGSNIPTTDYLSNPRTGNPDIGAYEVVIAGVPNVYVDSSRAVSGAGHTWADALKTLSEATDGAWAFPNIQKVFVAKGTYAPQSLPYNMGTNQKGTAIVSTDNRDKTFHIRQGLEVYGGYPSGGGTQNIALNRSVLDGKGVGGVLTDSAYHVVVIDSSANWNVANDTTKLVGFTVRNGNANGTGVIHLQGDIYTGNQFERYYGAGITIVKGLNLLKDNIIQNNTASSLGGGVSLFFGKHSFINNLIKNNKGVGGGGVYARYMKANFKNNIFYQNTIANDLGSYEQAETQSGGGMLCFNSKSLIVNNLFAENSASKVGGGLSLVTCFDTVFNNTFYKNKIEIQDSQAGSAGGGLFTLGGGFFFDPNYVSLKNNIFWKNMTVNDTTLIYSDAFLTAANGTVENNIFQLDSLDINNQPNYPTYANAPIFTNNKYKKNPRFLNGNNLLGADNQLRTNDDGLQLTGCSPAINSGLSLSNLGNNDVKGNPRIVYNKTDIGAYEYTGTTGCTIMSANSGTWENFNTWNISRIPFQKDNVILDNNHTVNITTNAATAKTLEYRPNSSLNFGNGLARFSLGL